MKHPACAFFFSLFTVAAIVMTFATGVRAQTETILHSFTGGSDGGFPVGSLVFDSKGNLYGAAQTGGENGTGAIFELTSNTGGTWTETVIYAFNYVGDGGIVPVAGLVSDKQGNLYGQAEGGTAGAGLIFELSPGSNGIWTENVLYNFAGGVDGTFGYLTTMVLDGSGNLYGTTEGGGTYGFGTVFTLVRGTGGSWSKKTLYSFSQNNDGGSPFVEKLVLDAAGNVYGTTIGGGAHDYGVVFELVRGSNGSWSEKILHSFSGSADGSGPEGGLAFDAAGNLYGNSEYSVFQLVPNSSGEWTENIVHTFTGGSDGAGPESQLTFDKAGNLFGTTDTGGKHRGTVFELIPNADGTWSERILHRFAESGGDGTFPSFGGLAIDSHGNLYGTTGSGGTSGDGVAYEIAP
jgi:uncharacterized repeat protein (TIGR03803 family)